QKVRQAVSIHIEWNSVFSGKEVSGFQGAAIGYENVAASSFAVRHQYIHPPIAVELHGNKLMSSSQVNATYDICACFKTLLTQVAMELELAIVNKQDFRETIIIDVDRQGGHPGGIATGPYLCLLYRVRSRTPGNRDEPVTFPAQQQVRTPV